MEEEARLATAVEVTSLSVVEVMSRLAVVVKSLSAAEARSRLAVVDRALALPAWAWVG